MVKWYISFRKIWDKITGTITSVIRLRWLQANYKVYFYVPWVFTSWWRFNKNCVQAQIYKEIFVEYFTYIRLEELIRNRYITFVLFNNNNYNKFIFKYSDLYFAKFLVLKHLKLKSIAAYEPYKQKNLLLLLFFFV